MARLLRGARFADGVRLAPGTVLDVSRTPPPDSYRSATRSRAKAIVEELERGSLVGSFVEGMWRFFKLEPDHWGPAEVALLTEQEERALNSRKTRQGAL